MKECTKCKQTKSLNLFYKKQNGRASQCKQCAKEYYQDNKESFQYKRNLKKDSFNENQRNKYHLSDKEFHKKRRNNYRHKKRIEEGGVIRNYMRRTEREKHALLLEKQYQKERKEVLKMFRKLHFNTICNRSRILFHNLFTKNIYKKDDLILSYIGCNHAELKEHISKQFVKGMSFENYGKWQVDHIYPLSKCESIPELIDKLNYSNIQPLWKKDNISKHGKILLFSKFNPSF